MSDELDLMAVGDLINAAFQRLHDKIEALEAELAAANAKIERYEHWIFSCNDCGPAEYAQRQLLSPQGSLAGNPLREENGTTGGRPIGDPEC